MELKYIILFGWIYLNLIEWAAWYSYIHTKNKAHEVITLKNLLFSIRWNRTLSPILRRVLTQESLTNS